MARRLTVELTADISNFNRRMNEATRSLKDMGAEVRDAGRTIGTTLGGAGLAVAGGLGMAIKTAADFESEMSRVAALSGASDKELKTLTETAKELGSTTSFSASEAAQGMQFLAMAGYETNDIVSAMPGLLDMAAAGQIDLASAADITSNILSGFGMEAENTGKVADTLTAAFTNANVDLNMLGETMKYAAPVAKSTGQSLEDMAVATMIMGDAGIQGSQAGTTLRTALLRLSKPTSQASQALKDMGVEVFDAQGNMKPFPQLLKEMQSGMDGWTQEQKTAALSTIFGTEAVSGMMEVISQADGKVDEYTKTLENSGGAAEEVASKQMDNLKGALTELGSAFEGMQIAIGSTFTPILQTLAEKLNGLVTAFNNMPESMQRMIAIGAALLAGLLLLGSAAGFLVMGLGALAAANWAVLGPVALVVAGIVALAAVFALAWAKSETFRDIVTAAFNKIKEVAMIVWEVVSSFIMEKVNQIKAFWDENGTQILQAVTNVFNGIKAAIEFVMPLVLAIVKFAWESIKGVIDGALNIIMGLVKIFTGIFTLDWQMLWDGIKQLLGGAIQFILNLMNLSFLGGIKKIILSLSKSAINLFKNMGKNIVNFFKNLWQNSVNIVNNMATGVVKWFTNIFNRAREIFGMLRTFGASIWNSISQAILGVARNIWSGVTSTFKNMFSSVKGTFNNIWSTAKSIFNKVKNAITNPIETAKNTVKGAIDKIKGFFSNFKVKIPMPRFNFTAEKKSILGMEIPVPKFSVNWFATGGLFDGPSVIGVGEAGPEAVVPLQGHRMQPFANAIAEHLGNKREDDVQVGGEIIVPVEIEGREVARVTAPYMDNQLRRRRDSKNRAKGGF